MLVSTLPNPRQVIKNPKWNTRGWVHQEAVFSKRRLIFTAHQVYFECNGMSCQESIGLPLNELHMRNRGKFLPSVSMGIFRGGLRPRSRCLADHIAQYSRKMLPNSDDTLNGVLGIFWAYERIPNTTHHYCGLLIEYKSENCCRPRSDLLTTSYYCLSCLPSYTSLLSCLLSYTLLYRLNRLHLPHVYIEALELHLINKVLILNLYTWSFQFDSYEPGLSIASSII